MPLKKDMNKDEICEYLEEDLKKSIFNDVKPIIQPHEKEGGYFGVSRLVLCYVDYLGALYIGYNGETDRSGRKKISTVNKAKSYIKHVLSKVDPLYESYGDLLYEMYRHGTVHLYQPKTFINKDTKETLSWLTHKGSRIAEDEYNGKLEHMNPKRINNTMGFTNFYYLLIR